ncbi:MAG TPA: class I SAM-dependent methyltransferase [Candidatus Binataceae bacterium]|nr:class I SAM-dependent methyltransferase [Candidatus Binataceae bacterium]
MAFLDPSAYGERIAPVYDAITQPVSDAEPAVAFLASIAGRGRILELGIGTGRIALPLAARGFKVCGIDASPKMVKQLRAKSGGEAIPVEIGNFADVKIAGKFSLIYVVFNTFFGLASQDEQLRCFARVAAHLAPGGAFVIEAFVPDQSLFNRSQRVSVTKIEPDMVKLDVSMHDRVMQTTRAAHVVIRENGVKIYPVMVRYAFPAELDLMAKLAGMRLRERWAGWNREPFNANSGLHVSIYEIAGQRGHLTNRRGMRANRA